ncbi:hypothetical protein D3C81_632920 [compost metagenome]
MLAEVQRAATVRQPAHDDLIASQHLLAVDTEVLPLLVRPLGDHQAPGNQGRDIAGPAMLDRQARQVDVVAFPDDFLALGAAQFLWRHVPHGFHQRTQAQQILEILRRLRLLQARQHVTDLAQLADILGAHAQRDPPRGAEQIAQHRHAVSRRMIEQQGRSARAQGAVAHFRHLQIR